MKRFLGGVAVALLSFAVGAAFLTASRLERRAASARQMLAVLQYAEPAVEYEDMERSVVMSVPWLTDAVLADVRAHRATADYWLADYGKLTPQRDASGSLAEHDPDRLFLAANAAFREAQRAPADRASLVKQLDHILTMYADVLKDEPAHVDAAYNLEYVARLRDRLASARGGAVPFRVQQEDRPAAGDLPSGATLHGEPGGYPPEGGRVPIKVVIPMTPDERQSPRPTDPGGGDVRTRKG
jgi:hypothetical protein